MRWDAALYLFSLLLFSLADLCWAFVETRGCNRTVRNSVGWIRWTGRMGRCVVRIRAPLRDPQVIEVKIRRSQVGFLKEARCEGAYVQFSDGAEDVEDETGRYCGHVTGNATRLFLRRGPDLTITMDSDARFAAENPVIFSAQFSILPARLAIERHRGFAPSATSECPLECTVRNERRFCRLTSPGYPGVYPRGIRCRIALESSAGRFKIGGQPEDSYALMNRTSQEACQTENCEEHVEFETELSRASRMARSLRNDFEIDGKAKNALESRASKEKCQTKNREELVVLHSTNSTLSKNLHKQNRVKTMELKARSLKHTRKHRTTIYPSNIEPQNPPRSTNSLRHCQNENRERNPNLLSESTNTTNLSPTRTNPLKPENPSITPDSKNPPKTSPTIHPEISTHNQNLPAEYIKNPLKLEDPPGDLLYRAKAARYSGTSIREKNLEERGSSRRVARSPVDRDEEDEFIIGQTSRKPKRGRNNRRKLKKLREEVSGSKTTRNSRGDESSRGGGLSGKGGPRQSGGYRDQGADSIQKRVRHPQRVHKKSMGSSIGPRRNFDHDLRDISDVVIQPDGPPEKPRKGLSHERITGLQAQEYGHSIRGRQQEKLGSSLCVGDYLAILESINGKVLEVSKFCGDGHVPRIVSRGRNVIVEFYAENDGTIMHDGFQLSLQETEEPPGTKYENNCEFVYKSSERSRENIRSPQSWYPPHTLCSYKFFGRSTEKISVHMKIIRNEQEHSPSRRNFTLNYCPGNEIAVYNGIEANNSMLVWSYCDASHQNMNNIQVPLISTGNELLIQYYSAKGSFDGQEFTYTISYRFTKKVQNSTSRRQVQDEFKLISLRPVNFSALNLNESENCNCDFDDRIGSFKNWFMVLVVLGIVSFLGAILTIIALLAKCIKMKSMEKKLLQTPKL
ncbi:hypothetical protein KM043_011212 [Ampulex compressa]|nr:hypothetical protein KM043_011212 [Ampulex compressa]